MKLIVALSLLSAVTVSADLGTCPYVLHNPKPSNYYCGTKMQPPAAAAARNLISSQPGTSAANCATIFGKQFPAVKAFDYDGKTCRGFGRTGKAMGLVASTTGHRFYNSNCFYFPKCFTLLVASDDDGGSPPEIDGKVPYADPTVPRTVTYLPRDQPAIEDDPRSLFYLTDNGTLYNNAVGRAGYVDYGYDFSTLVFPTNEELAQGDGRGIAFTSITCSIDPDSNFLSCTEDRFKFFACYLNDNVFEVEVGRDYECYGTNFAAIYVDP